MLYAVNQYLFFIVNLYSGLVINYSISCELGAEGKPSVDMCFLFYTQLTLTALAGECKEVFF